MVSLTHQLPFDDSELLERMMALGKQSYFVLDADTNELTWPEATFALWGRPSAPDGRVTLEWVFSTIHEDDRQSIEARYLDPEWNSLTLEYRIPGIQAAAD